MNSTAYALCYDVSLKWVTIVIALFSLGSSLPGAFSPALYMRLLKQFPRNYIAGAILTALAGFWFAALTAMTDLGEMSDARWWLVIFWLVGTLLQIMLVPTFLAVRGLAMLMLLGVCVILDSAFLIDNPAKYIMVCLAYAWAIMGIAFIASPYLMRDIIDYFFKTERQCRFWCGLKAVLGVGLLALGFFVY
jgi:hypothetical protein